MKLYRPYHLFLFFIFALSISSCKKKSIVKTEPTMELDAVYNNVIANEFKYEWFQAKAKCTGWLNNDKQNFNANIRIKKGEVIWVSMNVLGIEGARVMITPDSIKILDKLGKLFYDKPFSYINSIADLPVDFEGLEQLIVGNLIYLNPQKAQASLTDNKWQVSSSKDQYKARFMLSNPGFKPLKTIIQDTFIDRKLTIDYNSYETVESQQFSSQRYVNLEAGDKAQLIANFSRVGINEVLDFPFKVSSKYERIP